MEVQPVHNAERQDTSDYHPSHSSSADSDSDTYSGFDPVAAADDTGVSDTVDCIAAAGDCMAAVGDCIAAAGHCIEAVYNYSSDFLPAAAVHAPPPISADNPSAYPSLLLVADSLVESRLVADSRVGKVVG